MLNMKDFDILINDGSDTLSQFVVEQNTSSIQLYDWQRQAIEFFFKNNKAIFEVTTGAGKTFCSIEILKEVLIKDPEVKILIVVPKNVILEDTWFKELYDNGINLRDIGVFYGKIKEYGKITITNMQNISNIPLELFDMAIFDEIHNYGTERLLPYVNHPFKYKIGLSATMERMDNNHLKIMEMFDYNIFKYTPQEALHDGVLNLFNFVNISVEMDEEATNIYNILTQEINIILQTGGGFNRIMRTHTGLKYKMLAKMNERKDLVNNYYRKFDVVRMICNNHKKDKVIIFNEFNKQTSKSYWYLLDIGVKACVVHSNVPKEKREQNLIDFRNDKYQVMLTSKVLDEGYNLPKLDVAIIAAGNSTARQTVQRMGRVLRKKDKKSILYQIYCKYTIEEEYALKRAKLFKSLCSNYREINYSGGETL